jgi:hypothetical protein
LKKRRDKFLRNLKIFSLFKIKQTIMKSLSGINVTDMNTLLQLSGTMGALTQNPENLSPTTQVRQKI